MKRFLGFLDRLSSYKARTCMEGDRCSHTYAQLLEEIERWQSYLDDLNIEAGTVVAVRSDYSFAAVAALLALIARRTVVALVPRDRDTARYLEDAHAAALLDFEIDGSHRWLRISNPQNHPLITRLRDAREGGIVVFSSGSTGRAKAAVHGIEGFLQKFDRAGRCLRTLAFLLFDHVAGLDTLFYTFASGGTLVLVDRRDPESILELVETHRVEVLPTSPSFLRLLCALGDYGKRDLSSLKIITYGSELMDPSTLARLNRRFSNARIIQKYGTTEIGSPRSVSRSNDSLWLKIKNDGVETKVVDNVLWMRGGSMILGYLNAPSPIDEQGWYCTGDLVDVDGEWIKFLGRTTDVINVGGEKVAPAEVEQSILELDFVRDVLVSGEPHALLGEIVTARVALATVAMKDQKEAAKCIRDHCRRRLSAHKVPIRVEICSDAFTNNRHKARRKR